MDNARFSDEFKRDTCGDDRNCTMKCVRLLGGLLPL